MTTFAHESHPEPEVLAAFMDGNVKGQELVYLADHLRECEECRSIVGEAAAFEREHAPTARPAVPKAWWWGAAAAAALVAVAVIVPRFDDPLERLQPAPYRPYQGRLTAFDHAPFRATRSTTGPSDYRKLAAAAELQELAARQKTGENVHRFAIAQVSLGKTAEAIQLLKEASRLEPDSAEILTDLAAAQLAGGNLEDAAENAARAAELDPRSAAAAFNLALALELLSNRPAAATAWEKFLSLEPDGAWAEEAQQRLRSLRENKVNWEDERERLREATSPAVIRSLAEKYPQRVRHFVQDDVVPEWARTRSPASLRLGLAVAEAFQARDPFLNDLMTSLSDHRGMVEAIAIYAQGRDLLRRREMPEALSSLAIAEMRLRESGCPLHLVAGIFAATAETYLGRASDAIRRLDELERRLGKDAARYPSLMAELYWVRGLAHGKLDNPNRPIESYARALAFARVARESETEAAIGSLIATQLDRIGRPEEAQPYRTQVLRQLDAIGANDQRLYTAYAQAALASHHAGRPRTALAWVESQALIARRDGDPLLAAEVDAGRALGLEAIGQTDKALRTIDDGRRWAEKVKTDALRDRVLSDLHFIEGVITARREPARAERAFASALAIWDRYGWRKRAAAARLRRGDAFRSLGDRSSAEREYRDGIADSLAQRSTLADPAFRFAYFERSESLYARIIELLVEEERFEEALGFVEQRRARLLLEQFGEPEGPERPIHILVASIPANTTIIEMELLPDGAALWALSREGVTFARSAANAADIRSSAQRYRAAIDAEDEKSIRSEGRWLYMQLCAPLQNVLAPTIVFAPPSELSFLPFAALTASNGRYLIEHHAVAAAASASVYLASIERAGAVSTVLSIAAASGEGQTRLPQVREEALRIAGLYARSIMLANSDATIEGFLRNAPASDVIHFAGHAVVDEGGDPYLVLADKGQQRLGIAEIGRLSLPRHPMVVLAACGTARGRLHANEGVDNVASAFLRAGARTVVATLWDLDDFSSSRLFTSYHRAIREGTAPAAALRRAQLEMLHGPESATRQPARWAAPVVIGST